MLVVSAFDIGFVGGNEMDGIAVGRIRLGDFEERFEASLDHWAREDYTRHWSRAVARIVDGGASALVTSMHDPANANFIRWWPMYRFDDVVRFHEHLLFLDTLERPFSISDLFESVPGYRRITDDGSAVSEWHVPVAALVGWLTDRGTDLPIPDQS